MEEAKKYPPYKHAIAELENRGLLKYGSRIKWEIMQELIGVNDRESWAFRGQMLELSAKLKEDGFLTTEKNMNGEGIRIQSREEMADSVRNREMAKANDSMRNSIMLSNVPREKMDEKDIAKLDHWEEKSALMGATSKMLLSKRKLPSPELVIKSVKEIV